MEYILGTIKEASTETDLKVVWVPYDNVYLVGTFLGHEILRCGGASPWGNNVSVVTEEALTDLGKSFLSARKNLALFDQRSERWEKRENKKGNLTTEDLIAYLQTAGVDIKWDENKRLEEVRMSALKKIENAGLTEEERDALGIE